MERKAIHALLLSLAVITGAMTITTDAYAQTNTDRLITVVENTNNASSMLDMILAAVNDGVDSILAAISSLAGTVDDGLAAIDADLEAVDSDLMAIDADLQAIHGDLTAIDSDLQAVHGDLEDLHGDLAGIEDELHAMDEDLMTIHDDLTMVHGDIESLTGSVNALGQSGAAIADLAANAATTQQGVETNAASINELKGLIMQVSESLGIVQNQTAPADPEETPSVVSTTLTQDDEDFSVLVSAFGQNKASSTAFKTSMTFSCEEDVFLGTVMAKDSTLAFKSDTADDAGTRVLILANNVPVYDTRFPISLAGVSLYEAGADLRLMPLSAGSSIKVDITTTKTAQILATAGSGENRTFTLTDYIDAKNRGAVINGEAAGNSDPTMTKQEAGKKEALKIAIKWYTSADDAGCMLASPTGPTIDYAETDETLSSTLVAAAGESGAIQAIAPKVFTCDDETAVTKVTLESVPIAFKDFIDLKITAEKTKPLKFENVSNVPVAVIDPPLEFSGGDVTITGKIPGSVALVTVTYDTVRDSTCSAN